MGSPCLRGRIELVFIKIKNANRLIELIWTNWFTYFSVVDLMSWYQRSENSLSLCWTGTVFMFEFASRLFIRSFYWVWFNFLVSTMFCPGRSRFLEICSSNNWLIEVAILSTWVFWVVIWVISSTVRSATFIPKTAVT